jgi:hypothetical protein
MAPIVASSGIKEDSGSGLGGFKKQSKLNFLGETEDTP